MLSSRGTDCDTDYFLVRVKSDKEGGEKSEKYKIKHKQIKMER